MKRTLVSLLPILVLAAGCAVGVEDQGPWSEETTEESQGLDGTEVVADPAVPTAPVLEVPEIQGESSELDETNRPDPDPWMNGDDPVRPDPDPWAPSSTEPKSSSGSSGASED